MANPILLSIITPTRGNFTDYWLAQLLAMQGAVEFILVYPPEATPRVIDDPRVKTLRSPYKGELIQRSTGLVNASGEYMLALDDDDFLHPQVADLIPSYFEQYPESWCLRLCKRKIPQADQALIRRDWDALPQIQQLQEVRRKEANQAAAEILQQVPIAPLENPFKLSALWLNTHRTDHHGAHIENFNNIVWKRSLAQPALLDLLAGSRSGHFTWMPFWSLDRLLGLFVQAKFFQSEQVIGHWLHGSEQVRYVVGDWKEEVRTMFWGDLLLARCFPQYGYFWNLFWDQLWVGVKISLRHQLSCQLSRRLNRKAV